MQELVKELVCSIKGDFIESYPFLDPIHFSDYIFLGYDYIYVNIPVFNLKLKTSFKTLKKDFENIIDYCGKIYLFYKNYFDFNIIESSCIKPNIKSISQLRKFLRYINPVYNNPKLIPLPKRKKIRTISELGYSKLVSSYYNQELQEFYDTFFKIINTEFTKSKIIKEFNGIELKVSVSKSRNFTFIDFPNIPEFEYQEQLYFTFKYLEHFNKLNDFKAALDHLLLENI